MRATTAVLLVLVVPALALTLPAHQGEYPTDYFRSPLGIPIVMSGNFAEMRDSHFHGGLDIKTQDAEGYRIYAAADGYIERVKISPYGYGNALYVAHPNGFSTVYAHLSRLKGDIASFARATQYRRKSFAIDEYPEAGRFPVKKGQVIALSGNSGSSTGPHLHFEIRTTRDQVPVNPLLFGFDVDDSRAPRIFRIKVYPMDDDSGVIVGSDPQGRPSSEPVTIEVESADGGYRLPAAPILAWGRLGFGIQTHDYQDGSRSRLGAYQIRLTVDGAERFGSVMERISFADTRYLNAHVDYAERKTSRRWVQRSYRLPGNRLPIYRLKDDGSIKVSPGDTLRATYNVRDVAGNSASLAFTVVGIGPRPDADTLSVAAADVYRAQFDAPFVLKRDDFAVEMPANALYEDVDLRYHRGTAPSMAYSNLHVFHDELTPVHRSFRMSILPSSLPQTLRSKALIAEMSEEGKVSAVGGEFSGSMVTTRTRSFGSFFVTVDTTAPTVQSLDLRAGDVLGRRSRLRFRIKDELAGIASYDGYVDGEWALFAYDAKRDLLTYDVDPTLSNGRHLLRLEVKDHKDNITALEVPFRK